MRREAIGLLASCPAPALAQLHARKQPGAESLKYVLRYFFSVSKTISSRALLEDLRRPVILLDWTMTIMTLTYDKYMKFI